MRLSRKVILLVLAAYLVISTSLALLSATPVALSDHDGWCWHALNVDMTNGDSLNHRFRLSLPLHAWDHNADHIELYYLGRRVDGDYPVDDAGGRRKGDVWVFGIYTRWIVLEALRGGPLGALMTLRNENWMAHSTLCPP